MTFSAKADASDTTKMPTMTKSLLHSYSGLAGNYTSPVNQSFEASDKPIGGYQLIAPTYDLEKSKEVFDHIMKSKVTLLVGELCSVVSDIRN